jgi:hypothetical protein
MAVYSENRMNHCSGRNADFLKLKRVPRTAVQEIQRLLAQQRASMPADLGEFYFHCCIQRSNGVNA